MKTPIPISTSIFFLLLFSFLHSSNLSAQDKKYQKQSIWVDNEFVDIYASTKLDAYANSFNALAAGDNCEEAIVAMINTNPPVQKSLDGATTSGITPHCATSTTIYDTWFVTSTDANGSFYFRWPEANNNTKEYGITVWTDCTGEESKELYCWDAPIGFAGLSNSHLNPNQPLYIQIWTYTNSTQEVIIDVQSICEVQSYNSSIVDISCDNNTSTYSVDVSLSYATILENPEIQVLDNNGTQIFSTPATGSPQIITVSDLPADGERQYYRIGLDVCDRFSYFDWQAPNADCSIKGSICTDPLALTLGDFHGPCVLLSSGESSGKTPPCLNPSNLDFTDFWFQSSSDDIGSLRFIINEVNYQGPLTLGYALYEDCMGNAIACGEAFNDLSQLEVFVPAANRVPNKVWYLQVWAYPEQGQNICVRSAAQCGVVSAELGTTTCTDEMSFSQAITIEHFNTEGSIEVLDPQDDYKVILREDIGASPQTLNVTGLDATATIIDLFVVFSEHHCTTHYFDNITIPDCNNSGGSCEIDLILSGDNLAGDYLASNTISTEENAMTIISQTTAFKAGNSITLNPGFQVNSGTNFSAIIEDCTETLIEEQQITVERSSLDIEASPIKNESSLTVYPNPFSSYANIEYTLPTSEKIDLRVLDFMGREIVHLEHGVLKSAGNHQVDFQPTQLIGGFYFVVLQTGNYTKVKKLLTLGNH